MFDDMDHRPARELQPIQMVAVHHLGNLTVALDTSVYHFKGSVFIFDAISTVINSL
ncbi:MAG: hypothetical protein ACJ0KI_07935 [Dehalococcoidia bacterium]